MKWKEIFMDRRKAPLLLVAGAVVIIGLSAGLTARYVHEQKRLDGGAAGNFYFASDPLSKDGTTYTLAPDTTELNIELRNYEDELRWADMNISYTYKVTKDDGIEIQHGDGTIVRNDQSGTSNQITVNGLSEGTYKIEATSTTPFSETLTGTFEIPKAGTELQTSISDGGSAYVLVSVSTENYQGNITISWPSGLVPDATQEAFESAETYANGSYHAGSQIVSVEPYSSYVYRFFKEDPDQDFSGSSQISVVKAAN